MRWVSTPHLVAAVANAGALGFLSTIECTSGRDVERLVSQTRRETEHVFGVNVTLLPYQSEKTIAVLVDAISDLCVPVVETSGGNPAGVISRLKERGVKVLHKCASVEHALKAEEAGADAVVINGLESAGHIGQNPVPNMVLIPYAADRLTVPLVASGGFADGRGFVAALALGADGINIGTQFMLSKESPVSDAVKDFVVRAGLDASTTLLDGSGHVRRVANNRHAQVALGSRAHDPGASSPEIDHFDTGASRRALMDGLYDSGMWALGISAALSGRVQTCQEIVEGIINHADSAVTGGSPC